MPLGGWIYEICGCRATLVSWGSLRHQLSYAPTKPWIKRRYCRSCSMMRSKAACAYEIMLAIPGVDCEAALHSQHISASAPNAGGGARLRISAVGQGYLAGGTLRVPKCKR